MLHALKVSGVLHCRDMKKHIPADGGDVLLGAPAEIRTPDTLLKRQVLCRLSYWGILAGVAGIEPANVRVKV